MDALSKNKEQKRTLGKFFYDLAKLTFAALVLGALLTYFQSMNLNVPIALMLFLGIIMTVILTFTANILNK
jgi:hypothetical protein